MGDEPPGHRWRPAAALALLVAVTATVGVLIAVLQRPPAHAPIRSTPIPTPFPFPTPPDTQAPLFVNGVMWAGECTGPFNGFCSLTLTQNANGLDGTFMLSSPPDNLHIQRQSDRQHHQFRSSRRGHVHRNLVRQHSVRLLHRHRKREDKLLDRDPIPLTPSRTVNRRRGTSRCQRCSRATSPGRGTSRLTKGR
jgi:hypothetical protein